MIESTLKFEISCAAYWPSLWHLSNLDMTRHRLVGGFCDRKAPGFASCSGLRRTVSFIRRAAPLLPLRQPHLHTASRRRCHAAAQRTGASAEATAPSEAAVSSDGVTAAVEAATEAGAAPALEPVDVCEAHTLHVAVSRWHMIRSSHPGCLQLCTHYKCLDALVSSAGTWYVISR